MKWNHYHEELLKRWGKLSKTYSLMHSLSSQYYNSLDKKLGIPTVILGALTASSIFSSTVDDDYAVYRNYVNGGLTLVITALTGVSRFLGINEKKVKHTSASSKYNKIGMDIDTLLSFPRKERETPPDSFINTIKTTLQNIREDSPDLPTWIVSNYINKLDEGLTNTTTKINKNKNIRTSRERSRTRKEDRRNKSLYQIAQHTPSRRMLRSINFSRENRENREQNMEDFAPREKENDVKIQLPITKKETQRQSQHIVAVRPLPEPEGKTSSAPDDSDEPYTTQEEKDESEINTIEYHFNDNIMNEQMMVMCDKLKRELTSEEEEE